MKLYLHILIILNFLFSNLIFSQEETTKFYITELRGDISLEMEINNLESNKGPIYIRILDENENIVIKDLGKAAELDLLIKNALIASEEGYKDAQNLWDEISNKLFNPLRKYIGNKKIIFILLKIENIGLVEEQKLITLK